MPPATLDLVRGTVDLLILQLLKPGPLHGYAIATEIKERSAGELLLEEGALYPALHRLEVRDWVEAEWGVTSTGRKARYYSLTRAGRLQLKAETATWHRYVAAVGRILAPAEAR